MRYGWRKKPLPNEGKKINTDEVDNVNVDDVDHLYSK